MRSSAQFPIAVHTLLMIAYFPDIRVTSEMVATSVGTNPVVIRNVYSKLKRAGLMSVQRGTGSTELARPAQAISLWDVFTAVESGVIEDVFNFSGSLAEACPVGGSIRELLTVHLQSAVAAFEAVLSQTSIEELRYEIETHHEQQIDFQAIVEWYKLNGFGTSVSSADLT